MRVNPALNRNDSQVREMPLILSVGNYRVGKSSEGKCRWKEECLAVGALKVAECW